MRLSFEAPSGGHWFMKKKDSYALPRKDGKSQRPIDKGTTLGSYHIPYISSFIEEKTDTIEAIVKWFKTNPGHWQDVIVDESEMTKDIINIFIEKQLPFLIQFIFIEFNRIDCTNTPYYQNFINVWEFLRLLCEDHNPIFQTLLINYEKAINDSNYLTGGHVRRSTAENKEWIRITENASMTVVKKDNICSQFLSLIFKIPCLVLKNIKHSKATSDLWGAIKQYDSNYFTPLLEEVTNFMIEIIQGTYPENFSDWTNTSDISGKNGFLEYYKKHYQFLDYLDSNSEYEHVVAYFINFLNCFIEENANPIKIKLPIILKLNPKKLVSVALNAFKKWILKYVDSSIKEKCSEKLLKKFIEDYDDLIGDNLFTIATGIYLYLKRVNSYKDKEIGDKFNQILNSFIELGEDNTIKEVNSVKWIKKEYYLFCSTLIGENEISFTEDKSKDEKEVYRYKNYFSHSFKEKVLDKRNNNSSKKTKFESVFFMVHPDSLYLNQRDTLSFLEKSDYTNFNTKLSCILDFYPEWNELIKMRKMLNSSKIPLFLFHLPYRRLEVVNALMITITNLWLVFSRSKDSFVIMMLYFSFCHLFILFWLLINWCTFNAIKFIKSNEHYSTIDTLKYIGTSVFDLEIFCFVWTFAWGIPALLFPPWRFWYSLETFAIFNIFATMRSVLYAIYVRYKQFLSTGFLLVILIWFYAAVTFYFFRFNDDGSWWCASYWECFLFLFNTGIRGGGVDFGVKIEKQPGFWSEFIFSWVFYFIIILIILNIVNGIIVDTFQAWREQNNEIEEEKSNVCYICSLHRSNFEIKGVDFEFHIKHEHNIDNYFRYLIKIRRTDEHDLNSIDFQVFNSIMSHKIEFFPIKKAKSLEKN